ncbi:hypothetical protein H0W26_01745 [Candidatus Dependentiae bacterium]|nr:hypothetical protein [Candidatus Dependentiae bacterium]
MAQKLFSGIVIVVGLLLFSQVGLFKDLYAQLSRYGDRAYSRYYRRKPQDKGLSQRNGPTLLTNDEKNVPFFAATFSKGLEHDPVTGLLTVLGQQNYTKFLHALSTQNPQDFAAVQYAGSGTFGNPKESFLKSFDGKDLTEFTITSFPKLSSPEAAANLLELYLMA